MKQHRRLVAAIAGLCLAGPPALAVTTVSVSYVYDVHGRLVRANYSNGVSIFYTYDAAGNRTGQTVDATKVVVVHTGGAFVVIPVP